MNLKRERMIALVVALVSAISVLLIATTSSPLYATNFWTDTNVYFTIGRGMKHGLMPYTDLFDHKGPLLYMIYAAAAMISETSFLGVFALEVLALTAFLFMAYETVCLFGRGPLCLAAIPLTALITASCTAFTQGGSAEEFILPALMLAIYVVLRRFEEGEACSKIPHLYVLFGAAMGWVFAIKYTNCGLFFGLALAVLLYEWRMRGFCRAFQSGLWCLAGFFAVVLPVFLCMAMGGALMACLRVYFYENIFLYDSVPMVFKEHIKNALAYLRTQSMANPAVAAMAVVGCASLFVRALIRRRKGFLFEAAAMSLGACLLLLFTYWGVMAHPYYALVFAVLMPLGLCPFLGLLAKQLKSRKWALAALVPLALGIPVCLSQCIAVPLMAVEKEEMPQFKAAQIFEETPGAAILDWSGLDQGFYLASGILPTERYFANNNLNTEEKLAAFRACMDAGAVDYVITRLDQTVPPEHYELIADMYGVFDTNVGRTYGIYRLKGR